MATWVLGIYVLSTTLHNVVDLKNEIKILCEMGSSVLRLGGKTFYTLIERMKFGCFEKVLGEKMDRWCL